MFDIEVYDNKVMNLHEYTVRANFYVQVPEALNYLDMPTTSLPKVQFAKENFNFTYKFSISYKSLTNFQPSTLVGYLLRNDFLKAFEPTMSPAAIQRAMKYMSDIMMDDGFTLGLMSGTTVSSQVSYEQMKHMLAPGFNGLGPKITMPVFRDEFSEQAANFSTKEIFFQRVNNPVTGEEHALRSVIMNLNDFQKWSREQIADWIETLDININMKPKEAANG